MYFQPYGDEQQLNLNWIISEIINLHKQLDPDYETPSFTQVYPYSNLNRLNLDWVLSELKALKELAPEPTPTIDIQAVAEALVALPFDNTTSYQIYDFISRDGEIWRATEAIAAGGEWDSTKWFKTKLGTDLAVLERWINTINNSLSSEIEARQNADTTLQTNIDNEALARQNADTTLQTNIDNEALARQNADTTLQTNIDNEALARQQADTALRNTINGLTSANISDDSDAGGTNVKASLNALKGSLNTIESSIAIVANGNTHAAVASGQYVYIKNHSTLADGLYKATSAIPLNGDISSTNVSSVSNGGLNSINDLLNISEGNATTTSVVTSGGCSYVKIGKIVVANFTLNGSFAAQDVLVTGLPLTPRVNNAAFPTINNNGDDEPWVRLTNSGELIVKGAAPNASLRGYIYYTII